MQQQEEQLDPKAPVIDPALIGLGGGGRTHRFAARNTSARPRNGPFIA